MTIQSTQLNGTTLTLKLDSGQEVELEVKVNLPKLMTYSVGQRFQDITTGEEYLLSLVGDHKVMLIAKSGTYFYTNPTEIQDHKAITHAEFAEICGGDHGDFTLIQ